MNPWGTLNDWQRFEVDERVARYGMSRRPRRTRRDDDSLVTDLRSTPRTEPALSREDVAACA